MRTQSFLRLGLEDQLGGDRDGVPQAAVDRALLGEEAVYPRGGLPLRLLRPQPELDVDAADDEDASLQTDLAGGLRNQPSFRRGNLAPFRSS